MAWAWVAAACLLIGGCASSEKSRLHGARGGGLDGPATVDSSLEAMGKARGNRGASPSSGVDQDRARLLAGQSARDVDLLLGSPRPAPSSVTSAKPDAAAAHISSSRPAPSSLPSSSPPRIAWNAPAATAKSTSSSGGKANVHQPPLLRPYLESFGVRRPPPLPLATQPPAATQPASGPVTLEADRLEALMADLARELHNRGSAADMPLRQLLLIAAMSLIDPQRSVNPDAFNDLTETEKELLGKLQTFFADLGKSIQASDDVEQTIIDAVGRLRTSIAPQPELGLPTMALCTRVDGFGNYAIFDRNAFMAHSEQQVIVYLEIDDFASRVNPQGEHVTELSQQLTIIADRDGLPVWNQDWQPVVDVTKNRRQDFFTVQVITLPKALSVGRYQLKARVRDEQSRAEAEASVTIDMVADASLAASAGK